MVDKKCKTCKNKKTIDGIVGCMYMDADCQSGEMYESITMTNADRIRAMSDEELANWLARTQYANMMEAAEIFGARFPFEEKTLKGSEKECLEWLQQPAEGA